MKDALLKLLALGILYFLLASALLIAEGLRRSPCCLEPPQSECRPCPEK